MELHVRERLTDILPEGLMEHKRERLLWWGLATGAAIVAGMATRQIMKQGYRITSSKRPPDVPDSPEPGWVHALLWAAVSGFLVAIGRVIAQRLMASAWEKRTGHKPPGARGIF